MNRRIAVYEILLASPLDDLEPIQIVRRTAGRWPNVPALGIETVRCALRWLVQQGTVLELRHPRSPTIRVYRLAPNASRPLDRRTRTARLHPNRRKTDPQNIG